MSGTGEATGRALARLKVVKPFSELIERFVKPITFEGTGKYAKAVRSTPLTGATDIKAVAQDFDGSKNLIRSLVSEAQSTLGVLPDRDSFKQTMVPWLKEESAKLKQITDDPYADMPDAVIEDRLQQAGLILPGSRSGTPLKAKITPDKEVIDKKTGKTVIKKGSTSASVDAQVTSLLRQGRVEEAADLIYDQVENIAKLTPESLVTLARKRGGSLFYPLRSERNRTWSDLIGIPRRVISRGTSIGSANAGPYVEEGRLLSILPFMQADNNGRVFFNELAARAALGDQAFKGGLLKMQADAVSGMLNDADFLANDVKGLAAKTTPYEGLDLDPNNPLALVADNIGATARTGVSYAKLPTNSQESMYGQLAERVVAKVLGIPPSALQEIDWFVSRLIRGEAGSAVPFAKIDEPMMEAIARGERFPIVPHSSNPTDNPRLQKIQERVLLRTKQNRGFLHPSIQEVAERSDRDLQAIAQARPELYQTNELGEVIPNRASVEALMVPSDRKKLGQRAAQAIEAIRGLGKNPPAAAVAAILVSAGFKSLSDLMGASGGSINEQSRIDALRGMQ